MVMIGLQNPLLPKINQIHFREQNRLRRYILCVSTFYSIRYFLQPLPDTITVTVLKSQSFPSVPLPITANEVGMRKNNDTEIFSN